MLERFTNKGYGDYKCSCCKSNTLIGWYNAIGDLDTDEEGFYWRSFCDECWSNIKDKTNEEIYNTYEEAECID